MASLHQSSPSLHKPRGLVKKFYLDSLVGRARVGYWRSVWVGATTLKAISCTRQMTSRLQEPRPPQIICHLEKFPPFFAPAGFGVRAVCASGPRSKYLRSPRQELGHRASALGRHRARPCAARRCRYRAGLFGSHLWLARIFCGASLDHLQAQGRDHLHPLRRGWLAGTAGGAAQLRRTRRALVRSDARTVGGPPWRRCGWHGG